MKIKIGQIWKANFSGIERRVTAISGRDVVVTRWDEQLGLINAIWDVEDLLSSHTLKEGTQ